MAHLDMAAATCCDGADWCSVVCTSQVLQRKWQLLLVSVLLDAGRARFSELESRAAGISGKVLDETLARLRDQGIVERIDGADESGYTLTQKGHDLRPVVVAMREWGERYLVARPGRTASTS